MDTSEHLDIKDPKYPLLAGAILGRYERNEVEANITSAVRDFLIQTGLANNKEIREENPPSDTSLSSVDLTALDTFIEFKRRIGTTGAGQPDPRNVEQLDDYLSQSSKQGRVRMGILTDGKYWLLRWHGAGDVRLTRPYFFTLENQDGWLPLYEWLRDTALVALEDITPDREGIVRHFGPRNPSYQRDIAALKTLHGQNAQQGTITVKQELWYDLLRAALGEIATQSEELTDLFVRHTYLSAVIGMAVQASLGIDIRELAETEPDDLLRGRALSRSTGLQGLLDSDFFVWPAEVDGLSFLKTLARRVARFNWVGAPPDIAATLYEAVIPPEERRQLGEYYTPAWLAQTMVQEMVTDPLNQRVLDPACGSGTFITEAVTHFIDAAGQTNWEPLEILNRLRDAVTGIDVHPVAVHLARAAWVLAARPVINAAGAAGFTASLSVPVYLGDSLQLRYRTGDLFAEHQITIQANDDENTQLIFPISLVDRPENFDALMGDIADYIERGVDPSLALDDNHISDSAERKTLLATIVAMQGLHRRGWNHIWAYYTRNMVRPVALSRLKVDVIIGNPPWLNYRNTYDVLRTEMQNLSRHRYDIWAGGRYATHQDVAGFFFTRSVDLYLKDGGFIGFVMPHSALRAGQYHKWRAGRWRAGNSGQSVHVDFGIKSAWNLERLRPNTFFPVPASVIFAAKCLPDTPGTELALESVERWRGRAGAADVVRELNGEVINENLGDSPYNAMFRQGASIVPRCLFFVRRIENPAIVQAAQSITVIPRRSSNDKEPWKSLNLEAITGRQVESSHAYSVYPGESIAPYVTLEPLQAVLPVRRSDRAFSVDPAGPGGIRLGGLDRLMRERWETINRLWEESKSPNNRLNLLQRLDYHRELSSQLDWQQELPPRQESDLEDLVPHSRIVYTSAGVPTAAIIPSSKAIVDYKLFWIPCRDIEEGHYLLAIINSNVLYQAAIPLMNSGQFGARDLQKHLWKLPIPAYDGERQLHRDIFMAGEMAAMGAREQLRQLGEQCKEQEKPLTVALARRELRKWLRESDEGQAVEAAVGELLNS